MEGVQFGAEMSSKGSCFEGMFLQMALMEDSGSPCEILANWAYPPRNCGTHLSPPVPVCVYVSLCVCVCYVSEGESVCIVCLCICIYMCVCGVCAVSYKHLRDNET